ncbi:hypothetical protein BC830DRAFT_300959 [Chytriomyces sp. MP71]|nr:hypothetical protein BC830DRAFT_300959 [Chytriomyces sp. MP71]
MLFTISSEPHPFVVCASRTPKFLSSPRGKFYLESSGASLQLNILLRKTNRRVGIRVLVSFNSTLPRPHCILSFWHSQILLAWALLTRNFHDWSGCFRRFCVCRIVNHAELWSRIKSCKYQAATIFHRPPVVVSMDCIPPSTIPSHPSCRFSPRAFMNSTVAFSN